jgi:DNA gyrase subunit A
MFATSKGTVRRNTLSDFSRVKANGKLAMRLDEGDRLIGVAVCNREQDVLLNAARGKCIRFPIRDVRVFKSRTSEGIRGIRLAPGDQVISMSILEHADATTAERDAYVRYANAQRQGREGGRDFNIGRDRGSELAAKEQFILTVTENGFGKRTSSYEYRTAGRGGQGIINIETSSRNGNVIAAFPVEETDQIVLVTDAGQVIRCPVNDIRITGRNTQGVTLFRVNKDEHVVSVARLADTDETPEVSETFAGEDGSSSS